MKMESFATARPFAFLFSTPRAPAAGRPQTSVPAVHLLLILVLALGHHQITVALSPTASYTTPVSAAQTPMRPTMRLMPAPGNVRPTARAQPNIQATTRATPGTVPPVAAVSAFLRAVIPSPLARAAGAQLMAGMGGCGAAATVAGSNACRSKNPRRALTR
jgi:hypothetical protein